MYQLTKSPATSLKPTISQVAPEPFPVYYELDDYKPGGSAALAAGNDYHHIIGNLHVSGSNKTLAAGLYYVTGNVKLDGNNITGNITVVAEGNIYVGGSGHNYSAYSNELLFLSNRKRAKLSGNEHDFDGKIYVPQGKILVYGSNTTMDGCLYNDTVKLAGSKLRVLTSQSSSPCYSCPYPIADNVDASYEGVWRVSTWKGGGAPYGKNYMYHDQDASATFTGYFTVPEG